MTDKILFYGFATTCILFGVFTFLVKNFLRRMGYPITLLNIDFSDFTNMHSLGKKDRRYKLYYYSFILLAVLPLFFLVALIYKMFYG